MMMGDERSHPPLGVALTIFPSWSTASRCVVSLMCPSAGADWDDPATGRPSALLIVQSHVQEIVGEISPANVSGDEFRGGLSADKLLSCRSVSLRKKLGYGHFIKHRVAVVGFPVSERQLRRLYPGMQVVSGVVAHAL